MSSTYILVGIIAVLIGFIIFLITRGKSEKNQPIEKKNTQLNELSSPAFPTNNFSNKPANTLLTDENQSLSISQNSISPEIIAVITAAIVASTPKSKVPVLRNIVAKSTPKVVWAATGIRQNANIYTSNLDF